MIDFNTIDYDIIDVEQMPTETMQTIAEICGIKTAILIMEHFGGMSLAIPSKRKTDLYDKMAAVIGEEHTDAIFNTFTGEIIIIPARKEAVRIIIHQLNNNAEMIEYLIHKYGTTRSTVYRMIKMRPKVISKNGRRITFQTIEDFLSND